MVTAIKNYDVICYQLRKNLYAQLQTPLKKEILHLSANIKTLVTSRKKIQIISGDMLAQIFDLRIKALKWLSADTNFNYIESINEIVPQIQNLKANKKLEILSDNILFALRCNQRVVESFTSSIEFSPGTLFSDIAALSDITYQQFVASIAFANLDDEKTQKIVQWTNASLSIEFVLLATEIISSDELKVSDKTINDLAFLIADAAQEYSALATELGILKLLRPRQSFSTMSFDNRFIKEQKEMADLGLADLSENLL